MKRPAEAYCVSSGTLRTDHLIVNFADELDRWQHFNCFDLISEDVVEWGRESARSIIMDDAPDNADWVLGRLFDELCNVAGPGFYFGAAEGDGACFGFWPDFTEENDA